MSTHVLKLFVKGRTPPSDAISHKESLSLNSAGFTKNKNWVLVQLWYYVT